MISNTSPTFQIKKSTGELVPFDEGKLIESLKRVGAKSDEIVEILTQIKNSLFDGISSQSIYRLAFKLLSKKSRPTAARYNLKKGIMQLGPAGFAFEKYIAELLLKQGYKVKLQQYFEGVCVRHEIDIVAEKENEMLMIECKYHNQSGFMCDVKIPLYIHSRFSDILNKTNGEITQQKKSIKGWLITNTKFTKDAIKYGTCSNLTLISWDFPENASLKQLIDSLGLYPITCLTSLTVGEKQKLLNEQIVLCKDILENNVILSSLNISENRTNLIRNECKNLCMNVS